MLTDYSNQIADVVASVARSVVQVKGGRAPASGIVYGPGAVLTTARALGREGPVEVRQDDGRTAEGELAGWDPATGLAIVRAAGIDAAPFVPSQTPVRVGHFAVAIARSWSNAITASAGIVAVIGGPLRTGRRRSIDQVFRTTAPMHDGFAGGAFVDAAGGLIGVTTAASIRGLGVVIPASIAWTAAAHVLEHGRVKRGYLGIAAQPVALTGRQRDAAGQEQGLLVVNVAPGGPAASAGVLLGDIILSIDGSTLESPEQLMDLLATTSAGHGVRMRVLRADTVAEVSATVGERP